MLVPEVEKPPREWVSKYWQWIYSYYPGTSPLETGIISYQSIGGNDFLCFPCTGGGEDCSRSVTITGSNAKKDILIPVFAAAYNAAELGRDLSQQELLEQAKSDVRNPLSLELTVDGKPLVPYYVESLPFEVKSPSNKVLKYSDKNVRITLSAGYWYKLRHLTDGSHIIRFGGTGRNLFHTRVQYLIDVQSCSQNDG